MKFSIKDFFSKYYQIRRKLRIWSHLLKKSLMENFIFCAVSGALLWILRVFWEQLLCRKRERLSLLNLPFFLPFLSQYVKISSKLGERSINSQDVLDEFPFGAVKLLVLVQLPSWQLSINLTTKLFYHVFLWRKTILLTCSKLCNDIH